MVPADGAVILIDSARPRKWAFLEVDRSNLAMKIRAWPISFMP